MTAEEQARRCVVASVLMELQARAPARRSVVRPAQRSACARRLAGSVGIHSPCRRTVVASGVVPIGLGGAGVAGDASVGPTLCH